MYSIACWETLPWGLPSQWGREEWRACAPGSHALHLSLHILFILLEPFSDVLRFWFSFQELLPGSSLKFGLYLSTTGLYRPYLFHISFFWDFLTDRPIWVCKLVPQNSLHSSSHAWLPEELTPDTCNLEFYEPLDWLLPWEPDINTDDEFPSSFNLGWGIEIYTIKKLPS